jgi:hypothetical protein
VLAEICLFVCEAQRIGADRPQRAIVRCWRCAVRGQA